MVTLSHVCQFVKLGASGDLQGRESGLRGADFQLKERPRRFYVPTAGTRKRIAVVVAVAQVLPPRGDGTVDLAADEAQMDGLVPIVSFSHFVTSNAGQVFVVAPLGARAFRKRKQSQEDTTHAPPWARGT